MGIKDFYLNTEVLFRPAGVREGGFGDSLSNDTDADARSASNTVYPYKPEDRSTFLEYNRDLYYWSSIGSTYRDEHIYDRSGVWSVRTDRDIEVNILNLLRPITSQVADDQYTEGLTVKSSTITSPQYNLDAYVLDNDVAGGGWYKEIWGYGQVNLQFSAYPKVSDHFAVALSYADGFDTNAVVYYFDLVAGTYTRTDDTGVDYFVDVSITPNVNGWYDIMMFGHNEAQRVGNIHPTYLSIHPAADIGDISGANESINVYGMMMTEEVVKVPYIKPRTALSSPFYSKESVATSSDTANYYSVDYDSLCHEPQMLIGQNSSSNNVPQTWLNGNGLGYKETTDGLTYSDYIQDSPFVVGDYRMPLGRVLQSDTTDSTHSVLLHKYQNNPNVSGFLSSDSAYSAEMSAFIKKGTDAYVGFDDGRLGNLCPVFDLSNGSVHIPDSNRVYATIVDWGNGWWRLYARTLNDVITLNGDGKQEPLEGFKIYMAQSSTQGEIVSYVGSEGALTVSNEQFEQRIKPLGDVIALKYNKGLSFGSIGTGARESRTYRNTFTATSFATVEDPDSFVINGLSFVERELVFTYDDLTLSGDVNTGVMWEDGKWAHSYDVATKELRVYANGALVYSSDKHLKEGARRGYKGVDAVSSRGVVRIKEMTYTESVFDAETLTLITA